MVDARASGGELTMAGAVSRLSSSGNSNVAAHAMTEPVYVRTLLTVIALLFLCLFLLIPLVSVFYEALRKGFSLYVQAITEPVALSAIRLTLLVTLIVLPLNILFGLAASWAISRFRFPGK